MRATLRSLLVGVAVTVLGAAGGPVRAATATHETPLPPRDIKACVLDAGGIANPRIFVGLSQVGIRPQGWTFYNPLAPADRPASDPNGVADPSSNPNYWIVPLSNTRRLVGMDVIYMPVVGNLDIPPAAVEDGLIQAVENGALLWIDDVGGTIVRLQPPRTTPPALPFAFVPTAAPVAQRVATDTRRDILNLPFKLDASDIRWLGSGDRCVRWPYVDGAGQRYRTDVDFQPLVTLLDTGGAVTTGAMVAIYGNGAILVTAGNYGNDIWRWLGAPSPNRWQLPEIKFAFNALAWLFQMRQQPAAGGRAAAAGTAPPLDLKWQYPAPNRPGNLEFGPVVGAPLYFEGRVYVLACRGTGNAARLVCLDPTPEQDLCGGAIAGGTPADPPDGNPDDGLIDYANGTAYDVIWEQPLPQGLSPKSSGVVGAFCDPSPDNDTPDTIPVVLYSCSEIRPSQGSSGWVRCHNAVTGAAVWTPPGGRPDPGELPPYGGQAAVCDVSTPVVSNGWVFVTTSEFDGNLSDPSGQGVDRTFGRAWCFDLATGGALDPDSTLAGARWVFPDDDLDRAGPATTAEPQKSLPCFNDPIWVAAVGAGAGSELPPLPTPTPVISSAATSGVPATAALEDAPGGLSNLDALMIVGTPVTFGWGGSNVGVLIRNWTNWANRPAGTEYALAPTPSGGTGAQELQVRLNRNYYSIRLNTKAANVTAVRRRGGGPPPLTLPINPFAPTDSRAAVFPPITIGIPPATGDAGARQFLANWFTIYSTLYQPWADATPYNVGDVVCARNSNELYQCIVAHTSNAANDEPPVAPNWTTYWVFLGSWWDPLAVLRGWEIQVQTTGPPWETYFLRGPVLWQRQSSRGGVAESNQVPGPAIARRDNVVFASSPPVLWGTPPSVGAGLGPADSPPGLLDVLNVETGALRWRVDPRSAMPPWGLTSTMLLASAGEDDGTIVAALTQWQTADNDPNGRTAQASRNAVAGFRTSANFQVQLGPGGAAMSRVVTDGGTPNDGTDDSPVRMWLLEQYDAGDLTRGYIRQDNYDVDPDRKLVRIHPGRAHDVGLITDVTPGADAVAGKAVVVEWLDVAGNVHTEVRVFAPAQTFTYVPGFIKLNHYPVLWGDQNRPVQVYLPDDTPDLSDNIPVLGVTAGEPPVTWNGVDLLPNGWLAMGAAFVDVNGNGNPDPGVDIPAAGLDVVVSYTGFYEPCIGWTPPASWPPQARAAYTPDAFGFTPVPNPGLSLPADEHQVPVGFGISLAAPTVAGHTILVGTEGYDGGDFAGPFEAPPGSTPDANGIRGPTETLLALNWDPVTNHVRGRLARPAQGDVDNNGNPTEWPVVSAPVTVAGDNAIIGCRGMNAPASANGRGYVSSLATERTLIAAGSRIIECVGSQPVRTLTGTRSGAGRVQPFGHLAKVTRLPEGTLLVVDSGHGKVMELSSDGNVLWPMGPQRGSAKLMFSRPTDAWRYYTYHDFVRAVDAAGNPIPPTPGTDGIAETKWTHTVVADAGSHRIVEIVTKPAYVDLNGVLTPCPVELLPPGPWPTQAHEVYIVSPPAVATGKPGEFVELEYQKAQPILDPQTGDLWGYLACAANWNSPLIVVPPTAANGFTASVNPPAGAPVLGARLGAPLETPRITGAPGTTWAAWAFVYGLQFANIRHIEYMHYGGALFGTGATPDTYLWVVASSYAGNPPQGVWEFSVGLAPALTFSYTREDYTPPGATDGPGKIPLPNGQVYAKAFFPVSAQRLPNGDFLITNYAGAADNLAPRNLGREAMVKVLGSDVFRVLITRDQNGVATGKEVLGRYMIPDPLQPPWPEPLSLVAYAQRL